MVSVALGRHLLLDSFALERGDLAGGIGAFLFAAPGGKTRSQRPRWLDLPPQWNA
jgi:hypothetical protein